MIDRATIDRILDAVRIEEVIGDFVTLRKRGTNYLGLCPFHEDKNPSMSVSSTKGIFKCFSCGKAGTAVSFLMEHEHLSYAEALKYLAKKYHIEVVEKEESAEDVAERMRYESLVVVSEYAQKFFQDTLWNTDTGRAIGLSYFRERKFSDDTIRRFGLGYAAGRDHSLSVEAQRAGYKKEYLVDSGLCVERDNGDISDRFYERVMFPIYSLSGRVIAFGGRTLRSDKSVAKYVNSPETEIYNKSRSLYGLFQAKNAISKSDKCILVEGYADVISMHQAGIENVVASSGTSLTVEQIRLIKRFTQNVTIIYDGDEAGIKASIRGIDLVLEEGLNVKVVLLPPEDDPDSFAKAHSKIEILEYIKETEKDFITYKSEILARTSDSDPLSRARVINDIIQSVAVIPDQILRNLYADMTAERFSLKSEDIHSKIIEIRQKRREIKESHQQFEERRAERSHGNGISEMEKEQSGISDYALSFPEKELLYYLMKFGSYVMHFPEDAVYGADAPVEVTVSQYIKSSLDEDGIVFVNPLYKDILEEYYIFSSGLQEEKPAEIQKSVIRYFSTHQNSAVSQAVLDMVCDSHPVRVKEYLNSMVPEEQTLAASVSKAVLNYKLKLTDRMCIDLAKQVAEAQKNGDSGQMPSLVKRLQAFNRVKNRLAREMKRM
ncbi:MAG: DNA primase [Bacteroidales bacterium]|nr:DNA primase [Candidatus Cacconaster merdequi]